MKNADGLRKQNLVTKAIEHMHGMAILEVTTQAPLLYQFKYVCMCEFQCMCMKTKNSLQK